MKWLRFSLIMIMLTGCVRNSLTDNLVDTANQTIDTMYNAIPVECRNDIIDNLRATSKEQVKAISDTCKLQKDALNAKIREKNAIIFSLCALILLGVGVGLFLKFRR